MLNDSLKNLVFIKEIMPLTENGEADIDRYGEFTMGLNSAEIERYIQFRANKIKVKGLLNKFYKIAGVNTCAVYSCGFCGEQTVLMYRNDVERFADVLFGVTKGTYWD